MRASVFLLTLGILFFPWSHGGTSQTWQPTLQITTESWTIQSKTSGDSTPLRASDSTLSYHWLNSNRSIQDTISHRITQIGNEFTTTKTIEIRNGLNISENVFLKNVSDNGSLANNDSFLKPMTVDSTFQNSTGVSQSAGVSLFLVEYITVPFFVFCCIFGNTINILVMLFSPLRHMSNTMILVSLAISDSMFILLFPFNKRFFRELIGIDIRSLSSVSCKIFFFFFRTAKMSSACFVALISIERFVAIWFPLKAKLINSKKTIQREILLVVFFLSIVNLSWSVVGTGLQNGICVPHTVIEGYLNVKKEFVVYGISFVFIIPTLIMLVLSPMTVFRLYQNYRSRIQMTNNAHDGSRTKSTNTTIRATIMLLSVTMAFVTLTAPITFGHIYTVFTDQDIFESMQGGMDIFRNIAQIMELTNFSINFFIYFSISKSYRSYLLSWCRPRKKIVNTKSVTKTDSTQAA